MLGRRRWLGVVLSVIVIAIVEVASDTFLDPYLPFPYDTIVVVATIGLAATLFGWVAFRAIDHLAGALQRRNVELERRNASVRALQSVALAIAGLADLDAVLGTAVESARSLLTADVGLLVLAAPNGGSTVRAVAGPSDVLEPLAQEVDPADDVPSGADDVRRFVREAYRTSLLAAGVRVGGGTIGTLAVASARPRAYGADHLDALASLATQAGLALENDRLQGQLRELAVRDERARIARELHDGLAQVLAYVNAKSQAAGQLIENGRPDEARVQLDELSAAARSVYVDVREAILGLAGPEPGEAGILAAVTAYGRAYADASKLAVDVAAEAGAAELRLDPVVEGEVVRIVEEALSNVRKHASAARVEISLRLAEDRLVVDVIDDGHGLDPARLGRDADDDWPRYGIRSIRDRARVIGAVVEWRTAAGGGTDVHLSVPLHAARRTLVGSTEAAR